MSKMVAPENPVPSHEEDVKYVKEDVAVIHDDIAIARINKNEPLVTRRVRSLSVKICAVCLTTCTVSQELWSYYCESYTLMIRMVVNQHVAAVYYNGDNVRI